MTGDGAIARVREWFAHGRRVQSEARRGSEWWHRGVHVPACFGATFLLAFPAVAVLWSLAGVLGEDTAAMAAVVVAAPPFYVLYHVFVGLFAGDRGV